MLWLCSYEALPGVRLEPLGRRFLRQHDAGTNTPGSVRGWYAHCGGTSGVVLLEADTPQEVTAVIEPYASLVAWRVEPALELNYNQVLEEERSRRGRAARDDAMAGSPPSSRSDF